MYSMNLSLYEKYWDTQYVKTEVDRVRNRDKDSQTNQGPTDKRIRDKRERKV